VSMVIVIIVLCSIYICIDFLICHNNVMRDMQRHLLLYLGLSACIGEREREGGERERWGRPLIMLNRRFSNVTLAIGLDDPTSTSVVLP
jgi:hypothetical protein